MDFSGNEVDRQFTYQELKAGSIATCGSSCYRDVFRLPAFLLLNTRLGPMAQWFLPMVFLAVPLGAVFGRLGALLGAAECGGPLYSQIGFGHA